ncbi:hypothetical protein NB722_003076 [Xanthomonas sacchari]|nr:hypothetical protein [Xanthomonas sacchari]
MSTAEAAHTPVEQPYAIAQAQRREPQAQTQQAQTQDAQPRPLVHAL